jgi:hypothetical protein
MLYRRVPVGLSFDVLRSGRTDMLKPQSEKWVDNMDEGKDKEGKGVGRGMMRIALS